MTKFESRFFRALHEQDEDRQAMEQSLDQGTDPGKFDVDPSGGEGANSEVAQHTAAAVEATARVHAQYVEKINGWSQRLTEFNEFLNGTGDSVQSAIAGADEDTILKDLEDQQSRITRAATEIAALIQKFNSVITTENKASYRGV
jgi:phosphotransferase system HPr-like phosphotransfer protein